MNTNTLTLPTTRIAFASFIDTAIRLYDFYIYGLEVAALLVHETHHQELS